MRADEVREGVEATLENDNSASISPNQPVIASHRVWNVRGVVPDPAAVGLGLAAGIGDLIPSRHGRVPFGVRPVLEG